MFSSDFEKYLLSLSKWFWKILDFFSWFFFFKNSPSVVGLPTDVIDDLHHVGCLTDVIFNVSWVNVSSGPDKRPFFY